MSIVDSAHYSTKDRLSTIHHALRNRICLLDYPPGTRLSETVLAEEFGVSRTPLRKVLGQLETEGLITSLQGVGTVITDPDFDYLDQVYALRLELASLLGVIDPTPVGRRILFQFETLTKRGYELQSNPDPRTFSELNMDFFHALMKLTNNRPLRETSERYYYQTTRIWLQMIFKLDMEEEINVFCDEMKQICSALQTGDLKAIGLIRRAHISMSLKRLKKMRRL